MTTNREPPPETPEDELRAGLDAGARWAHEAIFRLYEAKVRHIIRGRARHLTAAELSDEVQDVFLALMDREVRIRASVSSYIVRAALNHCASRGRHWAVVQRAVQVLEDDASAAIARSAGPPSVTSHDLRLVRTYLADHPEEREVYELMYVEEIGRPEIMRRKNWPERYARTRMRRLHDRLSQFLGSAHGLPRAGAYDPVGAAR